MSGGQLSAARLHCQLPHAAGGHRGLASHRRAAGAGGGCGDAAGSAGIAAVNCVI